MSSTNTRKLLSSTDFTKTVLEESGALCDTIRSSGNVSVDAIFDGCISLKTSSAKIDLSNLLMPSDHPDLNQSTNTSFELQDPPVGGMYAGGRPGPGTHSAFHLIYDAAVGPLLASLDRLRDSITSCATDDLNDERLLMNIFRTALRNAGKKHHGMKNTSTVVIESAVDLVKSMLTKLPVQTFDLNSAVSAAKTFLRLNKDYDTIDDLHASEEYREMSTTNFRLKRMVDMLHFERQMMWVCDVGCEAKFWSYNDCVEHEKTCGCGETASKRRKVSL